MKDRIEIGVQGMTCGGCVNSVKRAVSRVAGVTTVEVDLDAARAVITGQFDEQAVVEAVKKAGFVPGELR